MDNYNASTSINMRDNDYAECDALTSSFDKVICRTSVYLFTPTDNSSFEFWQQEFEFLKTTVPIGYWTAFNELRQGHINSLASEARSGVINVTVNGNSYEVFNVFTIADTLNLDTGVDGKTGMDFLQIIVNFAMGMLLLRYVYTTATRLLGVPTIDDILDIHGFYDKDEQQGKKQQSNFKKMY